MQVQSSQVCVFEGKTLTELTHLSSNKTRENLISSFDVQQEQNQFWPVSALEVSIYCYLRIRCLKYPTVNMYHVTVPKHFVLVISIDSFQDHNLVETLQL